MATPPSPKQPSRRNSSGLSRDLEILEVLAGDEAADGMGVLRVAGLLGRDKATVSRAMATLADAGLLSRDDESRVYRIGPKIFALAARTSEAALVREARPFLRQIARHSRETTHLCVLRGGAVLTLISELSPNEVRTASWEGLTSDPIRTPSGRVLVSDWTEAELADWYAQQAAAALHLAPAAQVASPFEEAQPRPAWLDSLDGTRVVHDLPSLLVEAARIRRAGYATSDEELELGVVAASAPVRNHTGRVVAAINVSAPKARVGTHLERLGVYIARAAERLTARLGGPTRAPSGTLPVVP